MTPWQRIALVSSLLWIVSIPIFLLLGTNHHASNVLASCVSQANRTQGEATIDAKAVKALEDECIQAYVADSIAPQQMFRLLALKENKNEGIDLWAFMVMPIVLFWTAASVLILALRWITGVSSRQTAVAHLSGMAHDKTYPRMQRLLEVVKGVFKYPRKYIRGLYSPRIE
jgi:hypothetical protein